MTPVLGLIPAHAGKTGGLVPDLRAARAHPRSRGENAVLERVDGEGAGSSPLTRGKHHVSAPRVRLVGLIPAHAGKTRRRTRFTSSRWAHPRSRGENMQPRATASSLVGSSPLTRGKHWGHHTTIDINGLIPAHAGKTKERTRGRRVFRAHPRSRGENLKVSLVPPATAGSSPLTRGKPRRAQPRVT